MEPIFKHPVFDSVREKMTHFIRQLKKPQKTFENSFHTCFKWGHNKVFSTAKQVRSADEGTSVLNEFRD